MKPIKCRIRLHGAVTEMLTAEFESISKAKEWISGCWDRPYTIVRVKQQALNSRVGIVKKTKGEKVTEPPLN